MSDSTRQHPALKAQRQIPPRERPEGTGASSTRAARTGRTLAPTPPRLRAPASAPTFAQPDALVRDPYPLTPRAARWLQALDPRVNLATVRRQCPEILDRVARHWNDPEELRRVFDDLLFAGEAPRPRPPGCSFQALCEIAALRHHAVVDLRKWRLSAWDSALDLR